MRDWAVSRVEQHQVIRLHVDAEVYDHRLLSARRLPRVASTQALALDFEGHVQAIAIAAQRQTATYVLDEDPAQSRRPPIVILNDRDDVALDLTLRQNGWISAM